jgi:hypothetical protein
MCRGSGWVGPRVTTRGGEGMAECSHGRVIARPSSGFLSPVEF